MCGRGSFGGFRLGSLGVVDWIRSHGECSTEMVSFVRGVVQRGFGGAFASQDTCCKLLSLREGVPTISQSILAR